MVSAVSYIFGLPVKHRRYRRYTSWIGVTFLAMIASSVRGEETNQSIVGNMRSILASMFGRWMASRTFQVELIQMSSSGGGDLTILSTIEDGTSISLSNIQNVNDVHVRMETGSVFVREVTIKYSFFNGPNSIVASSLSSNDSAFPYTLSAGSNADIESMLQGIGLHEVTITVQGWFGYQVGTTKTIKWNILDITERPTDTPADTSADIPTFSPINGQIFIVGELQLWHKITLVVRSGLSTAEGATPNPFTDYRLDVEFRNGNIRMTVPGYYAADGNAQHTSATSGQVWHCHFAPTEIGLWSWQVSFLSGKNVAMANSGNVVGSTVSPIHGTTGSFMVLPSNKTGIDLRGKGLLRRIKGKHHLQFAGNGEWFLKAGADSPENFLAFDDFDNTPNYGNRRKSWSKHLIDFKSDDPTWANDKGKGIIGAINYLSGQGMRAFSFLTMNIAGDDENVYPYVDPSDRLRLDVSKLAQWEVVFEHGTKVGMFLHFKTQERENDQLLDKGELGNERKLYYRELIARFSHHLALNWNMGEENTNTVEQQKQFADWFKLLDPYKHPIAIHTWPTDQLLVYGPLYGYANYDGASLQSDYRDVFNDTLSRIRDSAAAGNPWVVANDEQGSADVGVLPDSADPNHDTIRREVLWGNIMAGGAGVEYYFGYGYENSDLTCEDFRSRANMWKQSRHALEFFARYKIPFQDMENSNSRVTNNNWCLAERSSGRTIVVYLRRGGTASINLSGFGNRSSSSSYPMSVRWYDPRNGGELLIGSITSVMFGNVSQAIGNAPNNNNGQSDWVVLLQ